MEVMRPINIDRRLRNRAILLELHVLAVESER